MAYFVTLRQPFPLAARREVRQTLCAVRVTPGLTHELRTIYPGQLVEIKDIDDDTVIFTFSEHWYSLQLDDFLEATQDLNSYAGAEERGPQAMSNDRKRPNAPVSVGAPRILCPDARRLLDAFGAAVRDILKLHEQQFLALMAGDLDCNRFDLLIHTANEKKQDAKYAYLHHLETHGCSSNVPPA